MAKSERVQARVTPIIRAFLDEIQAHTGENDAQWVARHAAREHQTMFPEKRGKGKDIDDMSQDELVEWMDDELLLDQLAEMGNYRVVAGQLKDEAAELKRKAEKDNRDTPGLLLAAKHLASKAYEIRRRGDSDLRDRLIAEVLKRIEREGR